MPFVNDFRCLKCGEVLYDEMTEANVAELPKKCPACKKGRMVKTYTKTPMFCISIESYMAAQRGHLGPKVKKSLEKEARLNQQVQMRRQKAAFGMTADRIVPKRGR